MGEKKQVLTAALQCKHSESCWSPLTTIVLQSFSPSHPCRQIFTYRSKDTSLPYGEHQLTIMVQRQTSQTTANNGAGFLASQWLQLDGMNKTQMYTGQPKITTLRDAYPGSLVCNTIAL